MHRLGVCVEGTGRACYEYSSIRHGVPSKKPSGHDTHPLPTYVLCGVEGMVVRAVFVSAPLPPLLPALQPLLPHELLRLLERQKARLHSPCPPSASCPPACARSNAYGSTPWTHVPAPAPHGATAMLDAPSVKPPIWLDIAAHGRTRGAQRAARRGGGARMTGRTHTVGLPASAIGGLSRTSARIIQMRDHANKRPRPGVWQQLGVH